MSEISQPNSRCWVASERRGLDVYQASLPLMLIATPRTDFVTCAPNETLAALYERNSEAFDHLPVVEYDAIVGVFDARANLGSPMTDRVRDHFEMISEKFLVGADVSILDFLQQAHEKPFCLLVTGQGINGLVSISDIQQLPVRTALFAMITQLEMLLTRIISRTFIENAWISILSDGRRQKLDEQLQEARAERNQVDPLLYTQFSDKARIVRTLLQSTECSAGNFKRDFSDFEKLRNHLAHANNFASSRESAERVSKMSTKMTLWLERLERLVQSN